ncbi:MAG: preprotein translocase subunit SecA, partial [Sulfobacillus sp.]
GVTRVERALGVDNLYADARTDLSHYLMQALKAHALMKLDRDYVVKDGEVLIVDEFTGRLMFGRRYSDGLHQAIEAKENVKIASENVTLATITFQNFFRMYTKLAGMTGTAVTEEEEFRKIYQISVVAIPTNMPMIREDMPDLVYKREEAKFSAVVEDIVTRHQVGQPVLVGTISIEKSEHLARLLDKRGIPHRVLNAKQHEKEAAIIAEAGQMGAVTIATNMAGRGTDIKLGDGVAVLGGLHVLGTERHESRRIDNQLRGRSGRQGDPGSSQFYVSLEDDLMRIFGGENLQSLMDRLGLPDDEAIQHTILTRSIERAQKRVESRNFDMRKHLLDYDDVMNTQREVVYGERRQILDGTLDLRERMLSMIDQEVEHTVDLFEPDQDGGEWNLKGMLEYAEANFLNPGQVTEADLEPLSGEEIEGLIQEKAVEAYEKKEQELSPELLRQLERLIALRVVDEKWISHMQAMDDVREGIGLRAYGQLDPLVAYKQEAFAMFQEMTDAVRQDMVRFVLKVQVNVAPPEQALSGQAVHPDGPTMGGGGVVISEPTANPAGTVVSHQPLAPAATQHIGRNDPCPCGSGKKYKRCHGRTSS